MPEWDSILDELQIASIKTTSADYTILDDDHYTEVWITTGASDITITLPTLADNADRKIKIRKVDSGAGTVIVDGEGSETINGETTHTIYNQYGWADVIAGSSEWIAEFDPADHEPWTAVTYINSWVDFSATIRSEYFKDNLGFVHLRLGCKNGSTDYPFVMPAGYRPGIDYQKVINSVPDGTTIVPAIQIGTDGIAVFANYSTSYCIDGEIIYRAEN